MGDESNMADGESVVLSLSSTEFLQVVLLVKKAILSFLIRSVSMAQWPREVDS